MATMSPATEFVWNVDMEVNLFHAMRGHKPAGVNRHFRMIAIHEKLSSASKKLTSEDVWKHLKTLYDLQALHDSEIVPFPNKNTDFNPPVSSYGALTDRSFPRSPYINPSGNEPQKQDGPSKSTPKPASKSDSKPTTHTPSSSQKADSSRPDSSKPGSAKSQSHKGPGGGGGTAASTPKSSGSTSQSQSLFTPDPSPKRTKRTRNVPSSNSSPATPTEPAAKRRR